MASCRPCVLPPVGKISEIAGDFLDSLTRPGDRVTREFVLGHLLDCSGSTDDARTGIALPLTQFAAAINKHAAKTADKTKLIRIPPACCEGTLYGAFLPQDIASGTRLVRDQTLAPVRFYDH